MPQRRLCSNNKEALRWCRARMATIQFANWRQLKNMEWIPEGITCCVFLGRLYKVERTLIKAVNMWISNNGSTTG
jgi:hypothetical protein